MDINFISRQNIDAIYDIINTDIVKNHNYNLDNKDKYKKIIKKYTKTIYGSLKNNKKYENILIQDFNNIVQNKSLPFIVIDLKDKRGGNTVKSSNTEAHDNYSSGDNKNSFVKKSRKKPKKSTEIENSNIFDTFSYNEINETGNENDNENDNEKTFTDFLKNNDSFNSHIKDANKKIKENLNKILSAKSPINNNKNNKNNKNNNNINKLETIIENKIGSNDDLDDVLNNNDNNNNNNLSDPSAFAVYDDDLSIKQTISNFYINQKDHSESNKVETYEDETYLPGLIKNIGEEAPIQPLLYQNSNQGNERITKQVIVIDSGAKPGQTNAISSVTNIGTNPWYKFRVTLEEPLKIDKLCDVYLRNICIHGADDINKLLYFVIDIDEINIINNSNNAFLKDKICVLNTVPAADDNVSTNVFTKSFPTESFYIASVNPDKFSSFTITLTNENNEHADTGDNKTFTDQDAATNRIIFELEFKNRIIRNEII